MKRKQRLFAFLMTLVMVFTTLFPNSFIFANDDTRIKGENDAANYTITSTLSEDIQSVKVVLSIQPKENILIKSITLPDGTIQEYTGENFSYTTTENTDIVFNIKYIKVESQTNYEIENMEKLPEKEAEIIYTTSGIEKKATQIQNQNTEIKPVSKMQTSAVLSATSNGTNLSDWQYRETNTSIELLQYIGASTDIIIPGTLNGKQVYLGSNSSTYVFPINITSIVVGSDGQKVLATKTCQSLFANMPQLSYLNLDNFDTAGTTNMASMFSNCPNLSTLDLSHINTANVTNMYAMFYASKGLQSLDLSHFDTSKVINMDIMFQYCSSLQSLNISSFNTSNVTTMNFMFNNCKKLQTLNILNFDTAKVTGMSSMFQDCSSLIALDLSSFNTAKVTNMSYMFSGNTKIQSLDLSHFDTSNVKNMTYMFYNNTSLKSLDVSHFNTANVSNMGAMFQDCSSLSTLDVSSFDTSNVTLMGYMFSGCSSLESLDVTNFNTAKATNIEKMFSLCNKISVFDLSSFDTSSAKLIGDMFWATDQSRKIPTIIINNDGNLKENTVYDTSNQGRVYAGPSYDANGGVFKDGTVTAKYFDHFIVSSKNELNVTQKIVSERFAPTKAHARFKGWFLNKECTIPYVADDTPVNLATPEYMNEKILYAGWENLYTVTFNSMGGSYIAPIIDTPENQPIAEPANPIFLGHGFEGWYIDDQFTTAWNFNDPITSNITLFAKWNPTVYRVHFDENTGTGSMDDMFFLMNDDITLTDNAFTKKGFLFDGWNTQADGLGISYANKTRFPIMPPQSMTLYAQWKAKEYTVKYDTQGAGTIADKIDVKYEDASLLPTNTLKKEGFTFLGWKYGDLSVTDANTYESLAKDDTLTSITLVAEWTKNKYAVDFKFVSDKNPDGISVPKKVSVEYGSVANEPKLTIPENWTFAGWYTDKECMKKFDFRTGITDDLTLYGKWAYTEPAKPSEPTTPKDTTITPPNTGDTTDLSFMLLLLGVSSCILLLTTIKRKKQRNI